jgi:hypothetical protein
MASELGECITSKESLEKNKQMRDHRILLARTKFGEPPASSMRSDVWNPGGRRFEMSASSKRR